MLLDFADIWFEPFVNVFKLKRGIADKNLSGCFVFSIES
jgi:hypothetical protein